jgi:hypothetical protein
MLFALNFCLSGTDLLVPLALLLRELSLQEVVYRVDNFFRDPHASQIFFMRAIALFL